MTHIPKDKTACIAGLGYVGLPLALAFSGHLPTIGFDVDAGKIRELSVANDNPNIAFTDNPGEIGSADFIIIAVPTPVTKAKDPDLSYIESAARTIGRNLKPGATVVLESTVYPGVTEEILKPILEHESGKAIKRSTVFDQTFVKSLRVRNALRVGLQFLAGRRLRDMVWGLWMTCYRLRITYYCPKGAWMV